VLIVDTGVLLAAADANDPDHARCAALLLGESGDLVTTALVIAETAYLIGRQLGASAEAAFFVSVAERSVVVDELTADDLRRIAALVADYVDLPLGGTDASVIALAERRRVETIGTLDRRHFSVCGRAMWLPSRSCTLWCSRCRWLGLPR
jgi:predicted nucleic acid-binding protein